MKNRIASIALTVVMILGCVITNIDFNVNTVCADPYNIEISVETKEISIEEIPENRLVPLAINVNNVPNDDFFFLDITYRIDSKLDNWINYCKEDNTIPSLAIKKYPANPHTLFIKGDTMFRSSKKISNGKIYDFLLFIPTEVKEGDFFELIPIENCMDDQHETSFALEANREEIFGPSNFSFYGGGIKIRSSQPEQPISNDPVPTSNNDFLISQTEVPNIQAPINNDTKEETTTVTSSETIYSTVSTASSNKSTTALSSITSIEQTESEMNVNVNTEALNTSEVTKEKSSNSNIIRLILFLLCLLIMVVALMITFKRRKKN